MLGRIGMEAFAERAPELIATGETVRKRSAEDHHRADHRRPSSRGWAARRRGPEIGAQLFPSARTVEWHLRRIFTARHRLRRELRAALAQLGPVTRSA
jgi:hypothetical protein